MASYQTLETEVKVLRDMVGFLMSNLRMAGFRPNGLIRPDGMPDGQVLQGTALDFYRLAVQENLEVLNKPVLADTPSTPDVKDDLTDATA